MDTEIPQAQEEEVLDPPVPTPGWVCCAKVDQQTGVEGDMQLFPQNRQGGIAMGRMPVEVISAYVISLGNWTDDQADQIGTSDKYVYPYEIGSKIYFPDNAAAIEIDGYLFIQWNSVIAWRTE